MRFVHEDPDFPRLLDLAARGTGIAAALVEKDYWVTHSLWALPASGLDLWFKGGTVWLWSGSAGVFSHETALRLHGLSDTLPSKIHLTLPVAWRERQLTPPPGTRPSFAEVPAADRGVIGAIPVTRPARTINDVATASGDAIVVEASVRQAIQHGLAAPGEAAPRGGIPRGVEDGGRPPTFAHGRELAPRSRLRHVREPAARRLARRRGGSGSIPRRAAPQRSPRARDARNDPRGGVARDNG